MHCNSISHILFSIISEKNLLVLHKHFNENEKKNVNHNHQWMSFRYKKYQIYISTNVNFISNSKTESSRV